MKKELIKKINHLILWYRHVIKNKNNQKLNIYNKFLALKHSFSNDFFVMYNLNKKNIKDYISEYERYLSREIDGDYKILLDNKIIFTQYFSNFISIPKIIIMILEDGEIYDQQGSKISQDDILKIMKNKKMIIKPINDGGGHGVHIFEEQNGIYYLDFEKISKEKLIETIINSKNCIVNEYVKQAKYAEKIFSKTVNTIRIITIKDPETNRFIIPCAVHRFGNIKTKGVDNASSGGYVTEINIESGKLGYTKSLRDLISKEEHPDTGIRIKDTKIPNWEKTKKSLIDVAEKFPYLPFIAWDVVITEDSFVILEANASCSLELFQIFGTIKNTKLGKFYKYHKIIK